MNSINKVINLLFLVWLLDADPVDDFNEYTTNFGAVFEDDGDALSTLTKISKKTAYLINTSEKVAMFIASGLHNAWKPQSREEQAQKEIHRQLGHRLTDMRSITEKIANKNRKQLFDHELIEKVQIRIDHMDESFHRATHSNFSTRQHAEQQYKNTCKDMISFEALTELTRFFENNCESTNELYNDLVREMYELQFSLQGSEHMDEWRYSVLGFRYNIHSFNRSHSQHIIKEMKRARGFKRISAAKLLHKLASVPPAADYPTTLPPLRSDTCRLSVAFDVGKHRRQPLFNVLDQLSMDIKRIIIHTTPCAHLLLGDDDSARRQYEEETISRIESLSFFIIRWVENALSNDWPIGAALEAQMELREEYGRPIQAVDYNNSAEFLREAFDARGEAKYEYQIIISRKLSAGVDFNIITISTETSHSVMNSNEFFTGFAFRYDLEESSNTRLFRGTEWFRNKQTDFVESFRNFTSSIPYSGAENKMKTLDDLVGPLVSPGRHHSSLFFCVYGTNEAEYLLKIGTALSNDLADQGGQRALTVELYEHSFWAFTNDFTQRLFLFA